MREVLPGKEERGVEMNSGFDLVKSGIIIGNGWDISSSCWIILEGEQK